MIATCILAAALAAPPTRPASDRSARATQPATARVGVLWIRAADISYAALEDEIRLRLPEVELAPYGRTRPAAPAGTLTVFVDVRPVPERELALTLVASDGRAYDRIITPEPDATAADTRELVARNVANLVFGIESGTVPADRADVPMPDPEPSREPCPTCPTVAPVATAPPVVAPARAPRVELGPALSLGVVTGLGPPAAFDRFAAWGGELDLGVRWRHGAALVVGLRTSGRGHPRGARIVRFRVVIGGGYVWRPANGAFELEALAGGAIEPWLVLDDGRRVDFPLATLPTLGVWGRLAPGWLVQAPNRSIAARIGAYAELDVAYAPAADGIIAVHDQQGGQQFPMFRVGGPELAFGIQTRLWFPVW